MPINRQVFNFSTMLFVILMMSLPVHHVLAQEPTQTEVDESFDPFADYNEYEQQSDEEEDINFLRNGRYLTVAFAAGYRGFLFGGFTQAYRASLTYGAEFNYFFNLQLAMGLSYTISDHAVNFASYSNDNFTIGRNGYTGSVNLNIIDFHLKYYFNTDNVTKGLADLNPYGIGGTSYYIRKYSLENVLDSTDQVWGFKVGAGIEIPIMKHRAYWGAQIVYRYVQFPDENKERIVENGNERPINPRLNGDVYDITFLLGLNF